MDRESLLQTVECINSWSGVANRVIGTLPIEQIVEQILIFNREVVKYLNINDDCIIYSNEEIIKCGQTIFPRTLELLRNINPHKKMFLEKSLAEIRKIEVKLYSTFQSYLIHALKAIEHENVGQYIINLYIFVIIFIYSFVCFMAFIFQVI